MTAIILDYKELYVHCEHCGAEAWQDEYTPRRKIEHFVFENDDSFTCPTCDCTASADYQPHPSDEDLKEQYATIKSQLNDGGDLDDEETIEALTDIFDGGDEAQYLIRRYKQFTKGQEAAA